jgi:peptide deformylase
VPEAEDSLDEDLHQESMDSLHLHFPHIYWAFREEEEEEEDEEGEEGCLSAQNRETSDEESVPEVL